MLNGDRDFWKRGLANAFLGMFAEQTLRNHLQSTPKGAAAWGSQVTSGDGRADLVHRPSGDVFEVKSLGSKRNAVGQLAKYVNALGSGYQAGSFSRISKTGSLRLKSTGFLSLLGAKYTYSPVQVGVVGWTLNNPAEVQANALKGAGFVAMLIGTSLLPASRVIVPLLR